MPAYVHIATACRSPHVYCKDGTFGKGQIFTILTMHLPFGYACNTEDTLHGPAAGGALLVTLPLMVCTISNYILTRNSLWHDLYFCYLIMIES